MTAITTVYNNKIGLILAKSRWIHLSYYFYGMTPLSCSGQLFWFTAIRLATGTLCPIVFLDFKHGRFVGM